MDRSLFFPFRGAPHQHREDPISFSHLPVLFDSVGRHETNRGGAGRGDDLVWCSGNYL